MRMKNRWGIVLVCLATVSSIVTIVCAGGVLCLISFGVLGLAVLLVGVSWLRARRRVSPIPPVGVVHAPYSVHPASEDDVRWASDLATRVYTGLDIIPERLMLEWFHANPAGFSIIKDCEGHRCGNIDILPLRPDTLRRFLRGELIEQEIRGDSVFPPQESAKIEALYVESLVAVDDCYRGNPLAAYRCIMSTPDLIERVCRPSQIASVYAIGASENGIRLMRDLGFDEIPSGGEVRQDGHRVFSVSFADLSRNIAAHAELHERGRVLALLRELGDESTL